EDTDLAGSKQVVAVSHDGGLTFSRPITIAHFTDIQDPIPGANFRTDSFVSAAVDQGSGAVYAAWARRGASGSGEIVVSKSTDGGATWSSPVVASRAADRSEEHTSELQSR